MLMMITHFNQELERFLQTQLIPAPPIKDAIHYVLFPGGKRLRPHLVYLIGELLGLSVTLLNPMAIAIELIHAYSLVHDDLPAMDNDNWRRGRPSCHKAFNEAIAILAGDALHDLACISLTTGFPSTVAPDCILKMLQTLLYHAGPSGMISGQSFDLTDLSAPAAPTLDHLTMIHGLKTAALIQVCAHLPLHAASDEQQQRFTAPLLAFTHAFGLTFQMQNDYLDAYHPTLIGKQHGSDHSNHKHTFATHYTQQELQARLQEAFEKTAVHLLPLGEAAHTLLTFLMRHRVHQSLA